MPRVVVFLLLLATVPTASFAIEGVKSAPAASGKLTGLPPLQTHIVFRLQNSTHAQLQSGCNERGEFTLPIVDASVEWSQPMPQGTYLLQTLPAMSCERLPFELASHPSADRLIPRSPRVLSDGLTRVFLHSGYSLEAVDSPLFRYSVAGKQVITLSGSGLYESTDVVVRFVGAASQTEASAQTVDVSGQVDLAQGKVSALTGAWTTPDDWCEYSHCHSCSTPLCLAPFRTPGSASLLGTLA